MDAKLQAAVAAAPRWETIASPVESMPRHVAIIMDGNGRWATQRGMVRINGHQAGVEAVRDITKYCGQTGIKALTLYAFSTENWKRPRAEVRFLFRLLRKYLVGERAELIANGVRLSTIGNTAELSEDVKTELSRTMELTAQGTRLNLCLALNYGGQDELLRAAMQASDSKPLNTVLNEMSVPPVDLLIRTAGERRLSNFLLWQADGAEYFAENACWPEFRRHHLEAALREFQQRRSTSRATAGV